MEIGACSAVVHIGVVNNKFRPSCQKVFQHQLLVLNGMSALFVILHGQPDIKGGADIEGSIAHRRCRLILSALSCHLSHHPFLELHNGLRRLLCEL